MHFDDYIERVRQENSSEVADSIIETTAKIIDPHIKMFSYDKHIKGLLLGDVQSGKTGHVFGIISAAADEGFRIFILLTTDNIYLQQQTYARAIRYLDSFTVCGEDDEIAFKENDLRKPTLVILKKNARVLRKWIGNLTSSGFCTGNPIFIIDDEADVASLNTKINQDAISTINKSLDIIADKSASSIYLQVTATPQAVLLQTIDSGWKPRFVQYFKPGTSYLGGDFFYNQEQIPDCIQITSDNELDDLLSDDEFPDNGLIRSLCSFLVISAHLIKAENKRVSNFLIHPSIKIADHELIADKIGSYLNRMIIEIQENKLSEKLRESWDDLNKTKSELIDFESACNFITESLYKNQIKIMVMNSRNEIGDYSNGMNIIVGGNSLGRGVTFPALNVVYYCRRAKAPQADTFWQHCRIFGYDRDKNLVRIFIPRILFKLFSELNQSNRSIISQIQKNNIDDIHLLYNGNTKPTRKSIIKQSSLSLITGGINYFPIHPVNKNFDDIDAMLNDFGHKEYHSVNMNYFLKILENISSDNDSDWPSTLYYECIKAIIADKPGEQGILIVRRDRDIAKNTGTLLSPNDRNLGDRFINNIVLILYRITGNKDKGWDGTPIWIPNIKFPDGLHFYKSI